MSSIKESYNNTDIDISNNITCKHFRFIDVAIKEANKSTMLHKHACVIVNKKKIVACAHNVYLNSTAYSIHAETNAINQLKKYTQKDIKHCAMYVVRIGPNMTMKYSKPCTNCMRTINTLGISKVYYSTTS